MPRSLGLQSDLMVARGSGHVTTHPDRYILRTPSESDYWFGNMVIFRTDQVAAADQIARFRADLPEMRHVTLGWDAPDMVRQPGHDALTDMGFDVEVTEVLTLTGDPAPHRAAPGIALRPIGTEEEWAQVLALQIDTGVEDGHDRGTHAPFVQRRMAAHRHQIAQGIGRWFGAFDGDLLVGDLGVILGDGLARYQRVETRGSHRRRGLCAALVSHAAHWAKGIDAALTPIILADLAAPAGRVYRRCGFRPVETMWTAVKAP